MNLGKNLCEARKKQNLSQEDVAFKLKVSRQTVSKWELDESIPNIYETKQMATLYQVTMDELLEEDTSIKEIEKIMQNTTEKSAEKIDWTSVWSSKYPILNRYIEEIHIEKYSKEIVDMLDALQEEYQYTELEAMLVLKDILWRIWKSREGLRNKSL